MVFYVDVFDAELIHTVYMKFLHFKDFSKTYLNMAGNPTL